jgi:AcrR family transcriptional regulator
MPTRVLSFKPRKTPVQARSAHTVEAIFQATVQVLRAHGVERLTTTRVAERAGVSVGTLYQYFPHKEALLASVLRRHLIAVVELVEGACEREKGRPLEAMAGGVVDAFVRAKLEDRDSSRALYGVAAVVGGATLVAEVTQRAQQALCDMLATARGCRFDDLPIVAYVWTAAMVGPVQGLLENEAPQSAVAAVREHLRQMVSAYLQSVAKTDDLILRLP